MNKKIPGIILLLAGILLSLYSAIRMMRPIHFLSSFEQMVGIPQDSTSIFIIMLVVGIVLLVVGLVLWMKGKKQTPSVPQPAPKEPPKETPEETTTETPVENPS